MRKDRVCEGFDRLREETDAWTNPERPKPKEPTPIDFSAPLLLSEDLKSILKPKESDDV